MRALRVTLLCLVALHGLSGCAFYQFRVWPNYKLLGPPSSGSGTAAAQQWMAANVSLGDAITLGEDLEAQYESFGRTHERTIPVLATLLIPITATVAGLAITGTTGAPVTALSLAGGSSFAYGTVLSSTQRERIYAQAKTATRCLINVYHPLLVGRDEYVKFREQLATDRYQAVRGRLRDAIDKYPRQTPADRDLADAAEAVYKGLADLHAKGLQADALIRTGGNVLVKQITQLAGEVNRALERTELDSAALKSSLIAAFGSNVVVTGAAGAATAMDKLAGDARAKAAGTGPPPGAQADTPPTPAQVLIAALAAADEQAAPIQSVLLRLGDNPVQDARECVDKAVAAIQLEPLKLSGDVTPTLAPSQSTVITITGGVRPYVVTPVGVAARQLTTALDDGQTAFAQLTLTAGNTSTPGTYSVEVTDKTASSTRAISVTIKPAAALTVKGEAAAVKQGDKVTLTVSGGTAPYTVDVINQASPFEGPFKPEDKDASKLTAALKSDAAPGDYTLLVRSAEPLLGQVKLKVEKK